MHHPFHHLSRPSRTSFPSGPRETQQKPEINLRRPRPVDLDLPRASRPPPLERGEVHVGELHRALDLEDLVSGEEHERAMGLDAVHG